MSEKQLNTIIVAMALVCAVGIISAAILLSLSMYEESAIAALVALSVAILIAGTRVS